MFNAKNAKASTEKVLSKKLNYQRIFILDKIKMNSSMGRNYVCPDDYNIKLFKEDWEFFKQLGYETIPDVKEQGKYTFGYIKW